MLSLQVFRLEIFRRISQYTAPKEGKRESGHWRRIRAPEVQNTATALVDIAGTPVAPSLLPRCPLVQPSEAKVRYPTIAPSELGI
jgi:hypothetical protein